MIVLGRVLAVLAVVLGVSAWGLTIRSIGQRSNLGRHELRYRPGIHLNPFPKFGQAKHYTADGWRTVRIARLCFWSAVVCGCVVALILPRLMNN